MTRTDDRAWELFQYLLTEEGKQDMWPVFPELHALGDLFSLPDDSYLVVGYNAAAEALRRPEFGKGDGRFMKPNFTDATAEQEAEIDAVWSDSTPNIVSLDPPDHTRLRALVQPGFMPRQIKAIEDAIPVVIDRLLDAIDPTQPVDIIASFSAIFAPEIVARLTGLPSERGAEVSEMTATLLRSVDPGASYELRRDGALAARKHRDYIREVVADRRLCPRDDLVTTLAERSGKEISEPELVTLLQTLYQGGYSTTAHMIGSGLVALLKHPDQFAALRDDRSLLKPAMEELLRYDAPIATTRLYSLDGASLGGRPIPPGRELTLLLVAANRDPKVFPDPDRLDIRRKGKPHLAFAGGPHFCLGSNLARYELERAFDALLTRFPNMRLADPNPRRTSTFHQRSFDEVQIVLRP